MALDGIHFPATTIIPSNLTANPVLTFFDMQHEFYPQYFSAPTRLKRLLTYKASALRAVRVISPSHFTTGTLMQRYRVPASKICEIPVGVADDFSTHLPAAHIAAVRQHYALPDKFVLYPANTWPHKNHDRLLQALALLLGQYHEAITLVCTGAQLQEQVSLRELAQRHALLDQQVQHLGYVRPEHMPALYCAATLLVFPSLFEGFGIPVVEAMACGCPVVCANTTSLPEVVGEAAITFDPFDVSSIADSLHSVWNSPKLQSWLRQVGLRRAERYRWSRIIPLIRRVYAEAWC